jgi:transposase-like protein
MSKLKGMDEPFSGRHFNRDVIVQCMCWSSRCRRSLRELVEMMAGRGLSLAHAPKEVSLEGTTILRWVKRNTPECVKRRNRLGAPAGASWRVDETCLKIRGKWVYLCHAVDRVGHAADFLTRRFNLQYFNNVIERDHRHIKSRPQCHARLLAFQDTAITLSQMELMHRIRKD